LWAVLLSSANLAVAQDSSTGAIRGVVLDPSGARIANADVVAVNVFTGARRTAISDARGEYLLDLLDPGRYQLTVRAPGMRAQRSPVDVHVGGTAEQDTRLAIGTMQETVEVTAAPLQLDLERNGVSELIDQRAIAELPLNGRRFTDLALLSPGVTQDPRGLTSGSNGDLSFGGLRGFNTSFTVDGADNNNAFFAQARGRYRAPYQFSDEVIQEFRVAREDFGVEQGRGSSVLDVVTRSGTNRTHASLSYDLRDGRIGAVNPFVGKQYPNRQTQFAGTLGGPIKRDKLFYFLGFDQHIFHVPTVVEFVNGSTAISPSPLDYETTDQALVDSAASQLSALGGRFNTALLGNAAFAKINYAISPRHALALSLNLSRFYGSNNVYFDPASPITPYAMSENGEEQVTTASANASLTSALGHRWMSHLRFQYARDHQGSLANSQSVETKITGILSGMGRSSILPRHTHERRFQLAETLTHTIGRQTFKLGGDMLFTQIVNYFPQAFGGEYLFERIKVNPFTFVPQPVGGLVLTPLRAYAHDVPRYYLQDFGSAYSHPDSNDYAVFAEDLIHLGSRLAVTAGLRYDRQTFSTAHLKSNPLWPDSGKVPDNGMNFAPRLGFSTALGGLRRPWIVRGGYGLFFTRLPQIYNSDVELNNGLDRSQLFLDNSNYFQRQVFPVYPNPLVSCTGSAVDCAPPANIAPFVTTQISAFSQNFRTPYAEQTSLSVEKEVARRTTIETSYIFVAGKHLIRARDANLPAPTNVTYPVYDANGNFTGNYYSVASFATWEFAHTLTCVFPPCINDLQRPLSQVGAINEFESVAASNYNGLAIGIKHTFGEGFYARLSYTWAHAFDNGQDALVAGQPAQVQNAAAPGAERATSSTDQRHRLVAAFSAEPKRTYDNFLARAALTNWRFSGILTVGSGRPLTATTTGDPNRDSNSLNDRLPGTPRNKYVGPDYMTQDVRLTRKFHLTERWRLEASAESYNLFNHNNKRVTITDNGFEGTAADFVPLFKTANGKKYPGYFQQTSTGLRPNNAFAPREVQFVLKLSF